MKADISMIAIVTTALVFVLSGCKTTQTQAEQLAGYTYTPIEPIAVRVEIITPNSQQSTVSTNLSKRSLLNSLPDNSVRISTRRISGSANVGVPSVGLNVGSAGNSYEVIIDFVNTQTINKQFAGKWDVTLPTTYKKSNRTYPYESPVSVLPNRQKDEIWNLRAHILPQNILHSTNATQRIKNLFTDNSGIPFTKFSPGEDPEVSTNRTELTMVEPEVFNIPVYVGIGLRLKANVTVLTNTVDLGNLPALTAAVESGHARGTMSVQTIGISGNTARSGLLLLSKIDQTTIQNAIQVLSSIKASIDQEGTTITPRIVGFQNTIGADTQGINLILSQLSSDTNIVLKLDRSTYATGTSLDSSSTWK